MRVSNNFVPIDAAFPFEGIDSLTPTAMLPPASAVTATNLTTFRGTLTKRGGLNQLGATTFDSAPVRLYNFEDKFGNNVLLACTSGKVYAYGSSLGLTSWIDLTPSETKVVLPKAGWSASGAITPGTYFTQATSLAVCELISEDVTNYYLRLVSGSTDSTHVFSSVNLSTTLTLTKTGAGYSTTSATIGFVSTGDAWWDIAEGVDTNLGKVVVLTNGTDPIYYWNGTAATLTRLTINLAGFLTAKAVAVFHSYLILLNFTTTTSRNPQSVAWSDTGLFTEWLSGNSGDLSNIDVDGDILRAIPYANNLAIFSQSTISSLYYVDPVIIFGQQPFVSNVTIIGPGAICQSGPNIFFASIDNLYLWDGGRSVSVVGDKISPIWKSKIQTAGVYARQSQLSYDQTLGQLWFFMSTASVRKAVYYAEIATSEKSGMKWFLHSYALSTGAVFRYGLSGQAFALGLLNETTVVVQSIYVVADLGVTIAQTYKTGFFTPPKSFQSQTGRWVELEIECSGNGSVVFSYDIGDGILVTIGTIVLTSSMSTQILYFDIVSRKLSISFTGSPQSFTLNWLRPWVRPGGPR